MHQLRSFLNPAWVVGDSLLVLRRVGHSPTKRRQKYGRCQSASASIPDPFVARNITIRTLSPQKSSGPECTSIISSNKYRPITKPLKRSTYIDALGRNGDLIERRRELPRGISFRPLNSSDGQARRLPSTQASLASTQGGILKTRASMVPGRA